MFEFLRKKKSNDPPIIYYKSGAAFFESQCDFGHTKLEKDTAVVALVVELAAHPPIRTQDGSQLAALRVASKDGGFLAFATTPSAKGETLQPGDVVLWVPYEYNKEIGDQMSDKRSGWIGLIRAKIKPEINTTTRSFTVACEYN
jgi:hypothetical protein